MRAFDLGSERAISGVPFTQLSDALCALPFFYEGPAAQYDPVSTEKRNNFLRGKGPVYFRHLSGD